jgi:toxin ParE1/3/4
MKQLVITLDANRDLSDISDYFLSSSVDAGERFVEMFTVKCQQLSRFPYLGRTYATLAPKLRGLALINYIIFYQIIDERIEILRIISG